MAAMTCPECGQLIGDASPERVAMHDLWKHPCPEEKAAVWSHIAGTAARVEFAALDSDHLKARDLLGELHQLVLRGMTYLDDDLNREVAA